MISMEHGEFTKIVPKQIFQAQSLLLLTKFLGKQGIYDGSGFFLDVPLNTTYTSFRTIVNGLKGNPFIDRGTKAMFLNLVWVDPNIDMWNFLQLNFEFADNYQIINPEITLRNFRPNAFDWSGAAIFALFNILKIVFSSLIVSFLVFNIVFGILFRQKI